MPNDEFLGVSLPEKSILDAGDYQEMHEKASKMTNMAILSHLDTHGPATPANLQRAFSGVFGRFTDLQRVGLVQERSTGQYRITAIGSLVVAHGATEGIKRCMKNEWEFQRRYS